MSLHYTAQIKNFLHEKRDAYEYFSGMGACGDGDFADFACQSLQSFRDMLDNPSLTSEQLAHMLRSGTVMHKGDNPESCWVSFMTGYLSSTQSALNDNC